MWFTARNKISTAFRLKHRLGISGNRRPPRGRGALSSSKLFVGSFLLLTLAGTVGLKVIPGLYQEQSLTWHEAAFTATSAVCVTGLIVVDTATYFTWEGQAFLLLLIQLGGLGMLTLTSMVITALGGRPSLRAESATATVRPAMPYIPPRKLIISVVKFTILFEAIGAILLYAIWSPQMGWSEAIWPAVFHSVSAFCNAGFSTNSNSLVDFQHSPATLLAISFLVVTGGLGFVTMEEFSERLWRKKRARRLSVHTSLVIVTTIVLLLGGWFLFALFEWRGCMASMPLVDKLSNSLFMSVTSRTAGFNSIDYGAASDSSNFLTILLMMIGGSPGSTAGGMKTTTFALLGLVAWSRLRSRPTVTFADRSIPEETIQHSVGLTVIYTAIVMIGILLITSIGDLLGDHGTLLPRMFEVVSAFNTVGLSMGLTDTLSPISRWILIGLMFVGRTGPLAVAAALVVRRAGNTTYRLAYEDVNVG
ncbi:TrkH family potassium uptake protein [Aureliella helgolandensis]|uniref:Ktr system potassium uptake protein B n=1 Tax=Aureliella helgolandensis TaxID=2527968 RepID=A0A518GBX9_9BACT|nr:potassium transporter TrkG [Aureliella helgolandensis]QDV26095.1 Ktr system potassium uptake protein B [Aureliella helgolandensis]